LVEVKITYETLFDLLRRERSRSELQSLDKSFYADVVAYLKEKKGTLREDDGKVTTISKSEQEKIKIQIKNIQKILRELYEIREKKVINLAINRVRTESDLIDRSNLLTEELSLYNETCELISKYKVGVLDHVVRMELPVVEIKESDEDKFITDKKDKQDKYDANETRKDEYPDEKGKYQLHTEQDRNEPASKEQEHIFEQPQRPETTSATNEKLIRVRIMNDLPKFLGQDKNIYGPYKKDDLVELPASLTNILLKKGRAELLD
jgi:DNA replication initiation complex subunit (GINS family)